MQAGLRMPPQTVHSLKRVLVVEDDRPLCSALARVVRSWGAEVFEAHTVAEGRALLACSPELVIVDLWLESENALGLVEEVGHHRPAPAIVAISGRASPEETFRLGQLGVRAFLPKPLFHERLVSRVEDALRQVPDLEPWISAHVGKTSLREMQSDVRRVMLDQAIAQANGSRSGAARILQVTRQAIQQVFHRRPDPPPEGGAHADEPRLG
jgi:DNA-binding NtrC family response regulator